VLIFSAGNREETAAGNLLAVDVEEFPSIDLDWLGLEKIQFCGQEFLAGPRGVEPD
jgi:hypothetical protein